MVVGCHKLTPGLSNRCKAKVQTPCILIPGFQNSPQGPAQVRWAGGLRNTGRKSEKCWGGFKPHVILPSRPKVTRIRSAHTSSAPCLQAHELCDRWISYWCSTPVDVSIRYCTPGLLSLSQSFCVTCLGLLSPTWSFSALSCMLISHSLAELEVFRVFF